MHCYWHTLFFLTRRVDDTAVDRANTAGIVRESVTYRDVRGLKSLDTVRGKVAEGKLTKHTPLRQYTSSDGISGTTEDDKGLGGIDRFSVCLFARLGSACLLRCHTLLV